MAGQGKLKSSGFLGDREIGVSRCAAMDLDQVHTDLAESANRNSRFCGISDGKLIHVELHPVQQGASANDSRADDGSF